MKGRIGLTAVLVAALMAFAASPASAATKKAGTLASGQSVVLLNSSGFAKLTLTCNDTTARLDVQPLGTPLDVWFEQRGNTLYSQDQSTSGGDNDTINKPGHLELSLALNSKLVFGQVYVGGVGTSNNDCRYTWQLS